LDIIQTPAHSWKSVFAAAQDHAKVTGSQSLSTRRARVGLIHAVFQSPETPGRVVYAPSVANQLFTLSALRAATLDLE